jgi:hypothetical protein
MIPPEGAVIPRVEPPPNLKKPALITHPPVFTAYLASELRHMPSAPQLAERAAIILGPRKIRLEGKATALLHGELGRFVLKLLEGCTALVNLRRGTERGVAITVDLILHVVASHEKIRNAVSSAVVRKYGVQLS